HILTISAEEVKKELKEGTTKIAEEINLPAFERSFSLPEGSDEEKISADYKNGILLITIPKSEKAIAKRIEVKINK
ncbi:MAG: Hsp20/alpha crystallin family protein, partial [Spirochaetales bacterium]|nr:Hsp20/alpha crystallin family protein [Spirochaetales bacterium]